jgi:hypothetical protein
MADGLPGHEHDFYLIVKENPWLGGHHEYSPLNEAFPYWFNGLVPLAYGSNDTPLKVQILSAAQYIIAHQQPDGWLGPETELKRRNFWGRYPVFLGLAQLVEAEPVLSQPGTIIPAMHRFVDLMHAMLKDNWQGFEWHPGDQFDEQWGRSRAADLVITLQWLYEKYPGDNAEKIWECMTLIYQKAYDWSYWFSEGVFIKDDLDTVPVGLTNRFFPYEHGVNAGQGLKSPAVFARLSHNLTLHDSARQGVNWTFLYHGTSSGAIIADEREAGLSPSRGVELCSVVETMFSLSYLYQTLGDNHFADRAELAAFNALPTMVTPDWWAHQYISLTNQPYAHPLSRAPFWNVGPYGPMFGLQPNYPCCTVDFPQGYPKFLSSSFALHGDNGIAHILLSPASVSTTLPSGADITITCATNYPFHHILFYTITSSTAFSFHLRIPTWSSLPNTTIALNGAPGIPVNPDGHTGTHLVFLPPGTSIIVLSFSPSIRIEPRANDTVSIHHGALMYVLPLTENFVPLPPSGGNYPTAPPESHDFFIDPVSPSNLPLSSPNSTECPWSWPWNLAIDPSTLTFHSKPYAGDGSDLPNPIWASDAPPTYMEVLACEIEWKVISNGVPTEVPRKWERNCTSTPRWVRLVPLGSARLHVGELPTVDLVGDSGGGKGGDGDQDPIGPEENGGGGVQEELGEL